VTPRLGSPRSIALTVTVLWDLAVGVGALRVYRKWKEKQG
jgi:hypothetical protein